MPNGVQYTWTNGTKQGHRKLAVLSVFIEFYQTDTNDDNHYTSLSRRKHGFP